MDGTTKSARHGRAFLGQNLFNGALAHCLQCGYALRGLPEPRCPECGRPFNPHDPGSFTQWTLHGFTAHAPLWGAGISLALTAAIGLFATAIGASAGCVMCGAALMGVPLGFVVGYAVQARAHDRRRALMLAPRSAPPRSPPPSPDE